MLLCTLLHPCSSSWWHWKIISSYIIIMPGICLLSPNPASVLSFRCVILFQPLNRIHLKGECWWWFKPDRQSEEIQSHKTPDRPSLSEPSILSSMSSPFSPVPPPDEGPLPSTNLTRANLTRHHRLSRRMDDPFTLQLMLQERSAQIKDAMRSLDTSGLPLPDSVVNKVAATSEGLLPMERYTIGSYHREPQYRVDDETLLRERMKNGRYHRRKV